MYFIADLISKPIQTDLTCGLTTHNTKYKATFCLLYVNVPMQWSTKWTVKDSRICLWFTFTNYILTPNYTTYFSEVRFLSVQLWLLFKNVILYNHHYYSTCYIYGWDSYWFWSFNCKQALSLLSIIVMFIFEKSIILWNILHEPSLFNYCSKVNSVFISGWNSTIT